VHRLRASDSGVAGDGAAGVCPVYFSCAWSTARSGHREGRCGRRSEVGDGYLPEHPRDTSAPGDVRAKALLRLAGCDEKLGKQAKQIYDQIAHDHADQPAAVQTRNRLALLKKQDDPATPTTMSVRKLEWAGLCEMAASDTDGELAVYLASDGNLYFGDLAAATDAWFSRPNRETAQVGSRREINR
jgi:hypothetical protein